MTEAGVVEPEEPPSGRPSLLAPAEWGAGVATALGAVVLLVTYLAVPTRGLGGDPLVAAVPTSGDVLVVVHAVLLAALGLAVVRRPPMTGAVVAAAAVPLPWTFTLVGGLVDIDQGRSSSPDVEGLGPVLVLLLLAGALLLGGVVVALATAVVRARSAGPGFLVADAIALVAGLGGLWVTVAADWWEENAIGRVTRWGGMLSTDHWAGRGAWLGLGLAVTALLVAAAGRGAGRRAAGISLVVVLVVEALRRAVLSGDLLGTEVTPYGRYEARLLVPLLAAQIVGAAGGAWLATTTDDGTFDDEGVELGAVDPGPPPDAPPPA